MILSPLEEGFREEKGERLGWGNGRRTRGGGRLEEKGEGLGWGKGGRVMGGEGYREGKRGRASGGLREGKRRKGRGFLGRVKGWKVHGVGRVIVGKGLWVWEGFRVGKKGGRVMDGEGFREG